MHIESRHSIAYVDGRQVSLADACLQVTDPAVVRGDGVFEVVRLYGGIPLELPAHMERLQRSADAMHIALPVERLRKDVTLAIRATGGLDRVVRIIATAAGRSIVSVEPFSPPPNHTELLPVEHRPSPLLTGVKSLSYGANMLANRLADEAGCWQALFVDPVTRLVTESSVASFVWSEHGSVFTPPLSDGILDSITRQMLLATGAAREESCSLDRLRNADGAGLLGTTVELYPVCAIRGIVQFSTEVAALTHARSMLRERIQGQLARTAQLAAF